MHMSITKSPISGTLAVLIASAASLALAEQPALAKDAPQKPPPSAETMIVDALLLRPLGMVATVLGAATFIVSLPFSLPTGSADEAAQALVVKPAEYTFRRPLGDIPE